MDQHIDSGHLKVSVYQKDPIKIKNTYKIIFVHNIY